MGLAFLDEVANTDAEVELLCELWALGLVAATTSQVIAAVALQAAPRAPMSALAYLGATGGNLGNADRDLERQLNMGNVNKFVAKPLMPMLPLCDGAPSAVNLVAVPNHAPHEWFAARCEHSRSELDKFVGACRESRRILDARRRNQRATAKSSSQKCLRISMSRYPSQNSGRWRLRWLCQGPVSQRRVTQLHDCRRGLHVDHQVDDVSSAAVIGGDDEDDGTMKVAWTILLWSLEQCLKGVSPSHDWKNDSFEGRWRWEMRGKPLGGELVFSVFHVAADMDYLCNPLALRHFNNATGPCFKCKCNRTTLPWSDLCPSAERPNHHESLLVTGTTLQISWLRI